MSDEFATVIELAEYRMDFGPKKLSLVSVESIGIPFDPTEMGEAALRIATTTADRVEVLDTGDEFTFVGATLDGTVVLCNGDKATEGKHAHIVIMAETIANHVAFQGSLTQKGWTYETR